MCDGNCSCGSKCGRFDSCTSHTSRESWVKFAEGVSMDRARDASVRESHYARKPTVDSTSYTLADNASVADWLGYGDRGVVPPSKSFTEAVTVTIPWSDARGGVDSSPQAPPVVDRPPAGTPVEWVSVSGRLNEALTKVTELEFRVEGLISRLRKLAEVL